jgi:alpha-aminoadipate/glutamate carrier protein LysW
MVNCLLCDAAIDVEEEELDEGDIITCEECSAEMRVVGVGPLELEAAGEDDEPDKDEEEEHWH